MGSDRARRTFDSRQAYRGVVWQQGRVTVEADANEAEEIRAAESRAELVDVVGPSGTPDDGYKLSLPVTPPAGWLPYDFQVGPGTFYVGGVRVSQSPGSTYFHQPEWVDGPTPPGQTPARELVGLLLEEQEISAVEDGALREVALGGPDTAQRSRVGQQVRRIAVTGADCAPALTEAAATLAKSGLALDAPTRQLRSASRLKADFVPDPGPTNVCEPAAQAGFLGAENQLIRVQCSGAGKLLWGYDNASFLYRVDAQNDTTLRLQSLPVDVYHQPRAGQYVEVLRAGVLLGNGQYAAASTGLVFKLAGGYDTDEQTVVLDGTLPAVYRDPAKTPRLFLRVWESELPFVSDTPLTLGSTGVRVTLHGGPFTTGDFWLLGVRPSHPQAIYPERYLADFQPPDGPRRWFTSLGVLTWTSPTAATIQDCRDPFDNLVDLSKRITAGCCTVKVGPDDVRAPGALQALLDKYAGKNQRVVICLAPGTYPLTAPLRLDNKHSHFTIEGCTDGAVLEAAAGSEQNFHDGLLTLTRANEVTLRQLRFHLPVAPIKAADFADKLTYEQILKQAGNRKLHASVGVQPIHCANLTIRDCLFRYRLAEDGWVFAAGVKASGGAWWPRIVSCQFLHEEDYLRRAQDINFLVGYLYAAALLTDPTGQLSVRGNVDTGVIDELSVSDCLFSGLDEAIELVGVIGGVHVASNTVRDCRLGFTFENLAAVPTLLSKKPITMVEARAPEVLDIAKKLAVHFSDGARQLSLLTHRATSLAPGVRTPMAPVEIALDKSEQDNLQGWNDLFARLGSAQPASAAAPASQPVDVGAAVSNKRLVELRDLAARLDRAAAADLKGRLAMRLRLTNNDVQTLDVPDALCFGLVMLDNTPGDFAITGNCFRGFSPISFALATIATAGRGTISGNVIANETPAQGDSRSESLHVKGFGINEGRLIAVTGNVFVGKTRLPGHGMAPAPMNNWLYFNAFDAE
jgi:hypothetical protein